MVPNKPRETLIASSSSIQHCSLHLSPPSSRLLAQQYIPAHITPFFSRSRLTTSCSRSDAAAPVVAPASSRNWPRRHTSPHTFHTPIPLRPPHEAIAIMSSPGPETRILPKRLNPHLQTPPPCMYTDAHRVFISLMALSHSLLVVK